MTNTALMQASQLLNMLKSDNPSVQQVIDALGDAISTGNISGTGIAIGRNARVVVQQLNLSAEQVAILLEARGALIGLDPERYQLRTFLTDKTKDFVGREHVFQKIDEFLTSYSSGYLILQGEPGLGKSAILAEYIRRTGCIAHFNVRSQGIVRASQFLESVCSQLIVEYGLPYPVLPANAIQDGAFLSKLLQQASERLERGERLVIAIDALDEVNQAEQGDCTNILCLPATLPDGVYFVMTRRDVEVPHVVQANIEELDLLQFSAENRSDVEHYIQIQATRPQLRAWIDGQILDGRQLMVDEFVAQLAELSEDNFMYLRHVVPEIERGTYQKLSIDKLPKGLEGYYNDHWFQMGMKTMPLPRLKITIVYILSEVRQPVSRTMITEILVHNKFDADAFIVQEVLDEWIQFLHEQAAEEGLRYSVYHASFRDFLNRKDIVQAAGVTIKDINALIADYLWEGLFGEQAA